MTDSGLLPAPEPGELGRTIMTDVLVGESDHVRIVARQVILFRSCVGLRLELIRAPGSSIEDWWESGRAAVRHRNLISAGDEVDVSSGFQIEIVEGLGVLARDGAGGGEDRFVIDYYATTQDWAENCKLQFYWPHFGITSAELLIPL